ncbi:bile acid:sodium symporter family protein [Streptomyces sp. YC537]|uniref:Bile acid:sodium symporter family protein n=2 Tax=Streptomyces boluensis TaxID=1775135 RepID=A0A964USS7_9ACTN|nr:bile acid:sodium symporter family protein [Streptomyces boluensis]NBE53443.1 bile acid:sodium symporter family protein [Streptomyces boluensis]
MSPATSGMAVLAVVGLIMLGLGLSLTPADFRRAAQHPRTLSAALLCQLLVLPLVCFGLVSALGVPPVAAVGVMLISACPGGPVAGIYSHLAGGDVALNITLAAVNSLLAVVTLPVITNLSVQHFLGTEAGLGLRPGEVLQVFAVVLVPVALGMAVRARRPVLARRAERPVNVGSGIALGIIVVLSLTANFALLLDNFLTVGIADALFALASLTLGYWVPRLVKAERRHAVAASMEIGFHNAALAIAVATGLLHSAEMAIAPSVYGIVILLAATAFTALLRRRDPSRTPAASPQESHP